MRSETPIRTFPVSWLTEVGVAGFFGIGLFVLLSRPEYDPLRRYISEYAVGPGGWTMRVGFVLLGAASLNLVPGFVDGGSDRARRVGWALAVWGVAVLVAAAFPVDLQGTPVTATGMVHLAAAGAGFLALFVAMALARRVFHRSDGWWGLAAPTRWLAILAPAAFVLEASVFSTLGWMGLGQWLLFGLAGGWLFLVGRRFGRLRARG